MSSDANTGNVIGGHKATLSNEHVGAEAKAHSAKILQEEYGIKVTKDGDEYTVEDDSSKFDDSSLYTKAPSPTWSHQQERMMFIIYRSKWQSS